MRAANFNGRITDFSPDLIMLRPHPAGPRLPGVGLAQWTSAPRRAGMFTHVYNGHSYGAQTLFSMDAQLDYLVRELRGAYTRVHRVVSNPSVTVEAASDEFVYNFEVPASVLENNKKLPRTDPRVQAEFNARRAHSRRARATHLP
jgi:hypothetical protein